MRSPLLVTAAHRGRLLELLAGHCAEAGSDGVAAKERAFLAGMLSLLDALLHRPLADLLREIGVAADVADAVLERRGWMGALLRLVEHLEAWEADAVEALLDELDIPRDVFRQAEREAVTWVNELVQDAGQ